MKPIKKIKTKSKSKNTYSQQTITPNITAENVADKDIEQFLKQTKNSQYLIEMIEKYGKKSENKKGKIHNFLNKLKRFFGFKVKENNKENEKFNEWLTKVRNLMYNVEMLTTVPQLQKNLEYLKNSSSSLKLNYNELNKKINKIEKQISEIEKLKV